MREEVIDIDPIVMPVVYPGGLPTNLWLVSAGEQTQVFEDKLQAEAYRDYLVGVAFDEEE